MTELKIVDEQLKRLGKFTIVTNHMRELWIRPLGPAAFTVWYILKSFCQGNGEICFPEVSQEDWAEYCGLTPPTFISAIQRLIKCGLLEIIKPKDNNQPYLYILKNPPEEVSDLIKNEKIIKKEEIGIKPNGKKEWKKVITDKNRINPFSNRCKFNDQIFNTSLKIFRGPPKEFLGPIYNSNTVNSNTVILSKDNKSELESSEPFSSTFQYKSRRPSLQKILQENLNLIAQEQRPIPKKEKPIKELWIKQTDWKQMVISEWNKIPQTNNHKDMTTNIIHRVSKYLGYLTNGIFFDHYKIDPDFLKRNKISQNWITEGKKFTRREILNAVKDFALTCQDGYWPLNKKSLPKSLDVFLYNPKTEWTKGNQKASWQTLLSLPLLILLHIKCMLLHRI